MAEPLINQKETINVIDRISEELHVLENKISDNHRSMSRKRKARLAQIRTLHFVEKLTVPELANALSVAEITIKQDLQFLKKEASMEAKDDIRLKSDMVNFVWEMNETYKERIKALWRDYKASSNEFVRVKQLQEVREQERTYIEFLQQFGLVVKEPEKVLHGITYVSHLGKKPEVMVVDENNKNPQEEQINEAVIGVVNPLH